eukprot:237057-Lingulodinium_polyedra.AAC.1
MTVHSPPADEFKQAAKDIAGGAPLGGLVRRKLVWCVREAMKERDQQALMSARAIALFRDERKARLVVRYKAVGDDLSEFSGTLGQERDFGTGATNITAATQRIIARMCTRFGSARMCNSKVEPIRLPQLLEHIRHTVMCITVDSAADE